MLATPVLAILDLIERLGPVLPAKALLTDVGSTKAAVVERAVKVFGKNAGKRFLAGHPMAGKEMSGVDYADADLFQKAVWFLSPLPGQNLNEGLFAEFAGWIDAIGARIAMLPAEEHDRLCAWISHVPQMISTALAAALVEEFGERLRCFRRVGRAAGNDADFGEPVFDVAGYCHQQQEESGEALWKVEQRLAHIRENLATRELAEEFEQAHLLRRAPNQEKIIHSRRHRDTERNICQVFVEAAPANHCEVS